MSIHIIDKETDSTAEVKKFRVSDIDYKYNYNGLLNRPAFMDVALGDLLIDNVNTINGDSIASDLIDEVSEWFALGALYIILDGNGTLCFTRHYKVYGDGEEFDYYGNVAVYKSSLAGTEWDTGEAVFLTPSGEAAGLSIYINESDYHVVSVQDAVLTIKQIDDMLLPTLYDVYRESGSSYEGEKYNLSEAVIYLGKIVAANMEYLKDLYSACSNVVSVSSPPSYDQYLSNLTDGYGILGDFPREPENS